jgi:hypothetical protein
VIQKLQVDYEALSRHSNVVTLCLLATEYWANAGRSAERALATIKGEYPLMEENPESEGVSKKAW